MPRHLHAVTEFDQFAPDPAEEAAFWPGTSWKVWAWRSAVSVSVVGLVAVRIFG